MELKVGIDLDKEQREKAKRTTTKFENKTT